MSESGKIFRRLAEALEGDTWLQTARPNQLPPSGDWYVWLLLAGCGFGKGRAATEWVRSQVESGKVSPLWAPRLPMCGIRALKGRAAFTRFLQVGILPYTNQASVALHGRLAP